MEKEMKLSPPWITFFHEVEALFDKDPEIKVEYTDNEHIGNPLNPRIKIYVDNEKKYDALSQLIPDMRVFGNVVCYIDIVPANAITSTREQLFRDAFANNPIVEDIVVIDDVYSYNAGYVVFSGDVVQFFNDDLTDLHGMKTMLYQDIAKDVFGNVDNDNNRFFFCTEQLS